MDDFSFDAPSSSSNKKTDFGSDDPTADFLAREQAILGGDADFLAGLSSGSAVTSPADFESNFPSFADHDAGLSSAPQSSSHVVPSIATMAADNDDDFGAFHSDFPAIETTESAPVSQVRRKGAKEQRTIPEEPAGSLDGFQLMQDELSTGNYAFLCIVVVYK